MQHTTSRDGTPIGYSRSGDGPPLLLVHGTTADRTRWARIAPALERHFTVHAMDRRGRGASGDAAAYSLVREAEDVAAVARAIAEATASPVNLLGHSYGALCSLEAALLTDDLRRLILYEPPVPVGTEMYPAGLRAQLQELVDRHEREAALVQFFREVVGVPERELAILRSLPVWQTRISLAPTIPREIDADEQYHFDPQRFRGMATPTLLLLGGDSPPVFRQAIDTLHAALPASRIAILPGQQHVAMDTAPELFLQEVLRLLE